MACTPELLQASGTTTCNSEFPQVLELMSCTPKFQQASGSTACNPELSQVLGATACTSEPLQVAKSMTSLSILSPQVPRVMASQVKTPQPASRATIGMPARSSPLTWTGLWPETTLPSGRPVLAPHARLWKPLPMDNRPIPAPQTLVRTLTLSLSEPVMVAVQLPNHSPLSEHLPQSVPQPVHDSIPVITPTPTPDTEFLPLCYYPKAQTRVSLKAFTRLSTHT